MLATMLFLPKHQLDPPIGRLWAETETAMKRTHAVAMNKIGLLHRGTGTMIPPCIRRKRLRPLYFLWHPSHVVGPSGRLSRGSWHPMQLLWAKSLPNPAILPGAFSWQNVQSPLTSFT